MGRTCGTGGESHIGPYYQDCTQQREGNDYSLPFTNIMLSFGHFSTRMTLLNWKEPSRSHQDSKMSLDSRPLIPIYLPGAGIFYWALHSESIYLLAEVAPWWMQNPLSQQKGKTNRQKELEPETWFVIKSLPFGGDKPGFLSPVQGQFMLFTEQIIHTIKCNLIKCTWKEKEIKSRSCS